MKIKLVIILLISLALTSFNANNNNNNNSYGGLTYGKWQYNPDHTWTFFCPALGPQACKVTFPKPDKPKETTIEDK